MILELPCRYPGEDGTSSTPFNREVNFVIEGHGIQFLGHDHPTMKVVNGKLYAFDTPKILTEVAARLEDFRKHGFKQIFVRTRFISIPRADFEEDALGVAWSLADSTTGEGVQEFNAESFNIKSVNAESVNAESHYVSPISAMLPNEPDNPVLATSYVEKSSPVLYALLDKQQVEALIQKANGNANSKMLQAPTVTMYSGQDAMIQDASKRPFVVGIKKIVDPADPNLTALQPKIRIVTQGTVTRLNATAKPNGKIDLGCTLTCTSILDVDTATIPGGLGTGRLLKIQIPEVAKNEIRSSMQVPEGKTLVLSSFREKDGKKEAYLALIQCHTFFPARPGFQVTEPAGIEPPSDSEAESTTDDFYYQNGAGKNSARFLVRFSRQPWFRISFLNRSLKSNRICASAPNCHRSRPTISDE